MVLKLVGRDKCKHFDLICDIILVVRRKVLTTADIYNKLIILIEACSTRVGLL